VLLGPLGLLAPLKLLSGLLGSLRGPASHRGVTKYILGIPPSSLLGPRAHKRRALLDVLSQIFDLDALVQQDLNGRDARPRPPGRRGSRRRDLPHKIDDLPRSSTRILPFSWGAFWSFA